MYEKVWDEDKRKFYYFNLKTQKYLWTKPLVLGNDDIPETPASLARSLKYKALNRKPPRYGRAREDLSDEEAAVKLQAFFRFCRDRKVAREYFAAVFEKVRSNR